MFSIRWRFARRQSYVDAPPDRGAGAEPLRAGPCGARGRAPDRAPQGTRHPMRIAAAANLRGRSAQCNLDSGGYASQHASAGRLHEASENRHRPRQRFSHEPDVERRGEADRQALRLAPTGDALFVISPLARDQSVGRSRHPHFGGRRSSDAGGRPNPDIHHPQPRRATAGGAVTGSRQGRNCTGIGIRPLGTRGRICWKAGCVETTGYFCDGWCAPRQL